MMKKYKKAIECYNNALKTEPEPEQADIWYDKGNILYRQKKIEEAIKCFNRAFKINPGYKIVKTNREKALNALSEIII